MPLWYFCLIFSSNLFPQALKYLQSILAFVVRKGADGLAGFQVEAPGLQVHHANHWAKGVQGSDQLEAE